MIVNKIRRILESTAFSTFAKLISPGVIVPGTLSVTATDLYFDADEEHPLFRQQDPKVGIFMEYCRRLVMIPKWRGKAVVKDFRGLSH